MLKTATIIFILATMPQAFEYQQSSPEALFPQQKAISAPTHPGGISNPALLSHLEAIYINLSVARPYGLTELNATNMSLGYSLHGFGIQGNWSQFGIKEYQEQKLEINTSLSIGKMFTLGTSVHYYNLAIDNKEVNISKHLFDCGMSILFSPLKNIYLAYMQDNIYSLTNKEDQYLIVPMISFGAGISPAKGMFMAWNIHKNQYGHINTFEASIDIIKGLTLKAGYAKETATYAAGCILTYHHITFSYGFRFHPLLGNTHAAGLTLTLDYLRPASISYNTIGPKKKNDMHGKKININTCSYQELKKIPGLEETFAKRIYSYRKIFGELDQNALYQVGLAHKHIKDILPFIYGLVPDKNHNNSKKQTQKNSKYYNKKKIQDHIQQKKRRLFMDLLQQGLAATQALSLTELVMQRNEIKIRETIAALTLPETNKQRIRKICGQ